jgi:hypothetical protein
MKYDELSELIEAWVTKQIEDIKLDPMELRHRVACKSGLFNGILIAMTDEEREKIAKRLGLKKKADFINDNGEDAI